VVYFRLIPEGKVTDKVAGLVSMLLLGGGLAVAAIIWHVRGDAVGVGGAIAVIAPAVFAMMLASTLLFFISQRKTPIGDIKVKVGDQLLPFASLTADGIPFHTDQLANKRTLLKFFRGGW
jgi:hypothetical protein